MKKLAIFASGGGSNALKIHEYFSDIKDVTIDCIVVNNPKAGIIEKAKLWDCDIIEISKDSFYKDNSVSKDLQKRAIDLVILAGFLWLIPQHLLETFPKKIINIHPALLPSYGGKGMYGMNVHKAVVSAGEIETGITIHWVDEIYDNGVTISQFRVRLDGTETPEEVAQKVRELEYQYFPKTIESLL